MYNLGMDKNIIDQKIKDLVAEIENLNQIKKGISQQQQEIDIRMHQITGALSVLNDILSDILSEDLP